MLKEPKPESNEEEYDLKASTKKVGQLYPVLKAADGEILDGRHRVESNPSWKTLVLENIKTPEEKIIARLIANFHRRLVSRGEKAQWINELAAIYRNQGLRVEGERNGRQGSNEIVNKICETTGLGLRTVMEYLDPSFKNQSYRRIDPSQHHAEKSPEEIIYNHLKYNPAWARGVIERFKQEHEKELLESPIFRKNVLDKLPHNLLRPMRPAIAFDPTKNEQIQELLRLKEEDVFPNSFFKSMISQKASRESDRARRARENKEGYEPVPQLYPVFIQECPNCICSKCDHANTCIERVRPGD